MADERLLRAVAEELKLPLIQIARLVELGEAENLVLLGDAARTGLRLVDAFLLSTRLQSLESVEMEPLSLASVLTDVAHQLEPVARQNNCDVVVSLDGKYGPAMANRQSLDTALLLLGYSVIEGWTAAEPRRREIVLGLHRSASGLVAGIFDDQPALTAQALRRGQSLYGKAGQAMPTVGMGSGAGIFVADSLMRSMSAQLYVSRHHKRIGLAAAFRPSRQLTLV